MSRPTLAPLVRLGLFILIVRLDVWPVCGQDAGQGPPPEKEAVAAKLKAAPTRVVRAFRRDAEPDVPAELGDDVVVEVENLDALLRQARGSTPTKKVVLFLDGRPLVDVTPFPPSDPAKGTLHFPLQRTERSRDVWTHLLGKPDWAPRRTTVSVGLEDGHPVESAAAINLRVIPSGWFVFWLVVFVLLVFALWALAVQSDVLRDPGPPPPTGRKPYSLARMQAAWWFFLVLASYLFIGMVTGDFGTTITNTVLGLIGISAGTAVGSAVIDAGKPAPAGGAVRQNRYWWLDVVSDANGVSFPRFQIAAWTLVLGIIFVAQVYRVLAMPTFDSTLLALLGISAGTYLGLKMPEK
jgi:hypothetical protein